MVPLQTGLVNGDQVEVLTSKTQKPSPDWLRFVVTGKARARIRRFIRIQHRHEYRELGRGILDKAFRQEQRRLTKKAIARAVQTFQVQDEDDLFIRIGEGRLSGPEIVNKLFPATYRRRRTRQSARTVNPPQEREWRGIGRDRHQHSRPDPRDGRSLRPLLPSATGRTHCRNRHHRQGRHGPHRRMRHPAAFQQHAEPLARPVVG